MRLSFNHDISLQFKGTIEKKKQTGKDQVSDRKQ